MGKEMCQNCIFFKSSGLFEYTASVLKTVHNYNYPSFGEPLMASAFSNSL